MTITEQLPSSESIRWTPLCRRTDLEVGWGEAALVGTAQAAIFLVPDGRIFAVSNHDPATGAAVMSRGIVGSRAGRATIASPLHKDVFDLQTGECYTRPGELHLPTWWVREDEGVIFVAPRPVLVAASHGTADPAGQRAVAGLVDAVRAARPELVVEPSFVDVQEPDVARTLAGLPDEVGARIVPLLLSAGFHVHVDLQQTRQATQRPVTVSGALGPDRRLAQLLHRRLLEAGFDAESTDRVVLGAAGSTDASAVRDCRLTAAYLAELVQRPVTAAFLAHAEPGLAAAVQQVREEGPGRVFVATYLLAPGFFAGRAAAAGADVTTEPLLTADGPVPPELVEIVGELYDGRD